MIQSILNKMLGCSHHRTTFPQTPQRKNGALQSTAAVRNGNTYVACLDCGKEFAYNWSEMRVGQPVPSRVAAPAARVTA
jgi:hypothetical protein